jgi:hypothetical protein
MNLSLDWTLGNAKLRKSYPGRYVVGWGLPAVTTCPYAGACKAVCYATQGSYTYPVVRAARERNLAASKRADFVERLTTDLQALVKRAERKGLKLTVRVHDSGDFYSLAHLKAWLDVARSHPSVAFYAYTMSLPIVRAHKPPPNFTLIQSVGGKADKEIDTSKPHARIFSSDKARKAAGYVDGNKSDLPAMQGKIKIGLVYHGSRKLTEAQTNYFR